MNSNINFAIIVSHGIKSLERSKHDFFEYQTSVVLFIALTRQTVRPTRLGETNRPILHLYVCDLMHEPKPLLSYLQRARESLHLSLYLSLHSQVFLFDMQGGSGGTRVAPGTGGSAASDLLAVRVLSPPLVPVTRVSLDLLGKATPGKMGTKGPAPATIETKMTAAPVKSALHALKTGNPDGDGVRSLGRVLKVSRKSNRK